MENLDLKEIAKNSLTFAEYHQKMEQLRNRVYEHQRTPHFTKTKDDENDDDEVLTTDVYANNEESLKNHIKAKAVFESVQEQELIKVLAMKSENFTQFHEYMKKLRSEP
jgi:UDP-N-acetylmuramate-alanine ligase